MQQKTNQQRRRNAARSSYGTAELFKQRIKKSQEKSKPLQK